MEGEFYRVSSTCSRDYTENEYLNNIKAAQKEISIICGKFNPIFYDSEEFVTSIKQFLETYGGRISIIFHASSTRKDAVSKKSFIAYL